MYLVDVIATNIFFITFEIPVHILTFSLILQFLYNQINYYFFFFVLKSKRLILTHSLRALNKIKFKSMNVAYFVKRLGFFFSPTWIQEINIILETLNYKHFLELGTFRFLIVTKNYIYL